MLPSALRLLVVWLLVCSTVQATQFTFASEGQAQAIVGSTDEYIVRLSALERSLKAKSAGPVSQQAFLALAASAARPWQRDERVTVRQALASIRPRIEELRLPLPAEVAFVRSSGLGEGGASHTGKRRGSN